MERRELLRALASATALTILPRKTLSAWSRVATGVRLTNGLNDAQMILVRAIADTILPRTDTPSATDVGVHQFVDVMVAEYSTEEDRKNFLAGLDAIDARARTESTVPFAQLSAEARAKLIEGLESGDRRAEPSQTYWRLKGLVVHGYFTSERVMKDVMKHVVMPGKFEGAAPVQIKRRPSTTRTTPSDGHEAHIHG